MHHFLLAQRAVLTGGQLAVEQQWANAFAVQAHDLVIEEAKHAFDLMVAPLDDTQARTVRAKQLQRGGQGGQVFKGEIDAFAEFADIGLGDFLLGLDVIHLGHLGLRLGYVARPMPVISDQQQPAGIEIQSAGDVQVVLVGLIKQVEHRWVLYILGSAHATGWLVQHEVTCRLACLQDVSVKLDSAECADFMARIADDLPVNPDSLFYQEQAYLLAVELGQVAQETVYTHSDQSQGIQTSILREVLRLRWWQWVQNLCAAWAKAGQVALFFGQCPDDGRVNSHAIAPAGLVCRVRVGLGAVVTGTAGGAKVGGGHVRASVVGGHLSTLW